MKGKTARLSRSTSTSQTGLEGVFASFEKGESKLEEP
jgi:hypothetical protein